jgi:hypothetical protein
LSKLRLRTSLTETPDALRKLKIITDDTPYIDLTEDQNTPLRVSSEQDDDSSYCDAEIDALEYARTEVEVTEAPPASRSIAASQTLGLDQTAAQNIKDRKKKRKALEIQLEDIEEEQRLFELGQRKRRVRRELAQLDDSE